MTIKKLFLIASFAFAALSTNAQQTLDINLYNTTPTYKSDDSTDSAKMRIYLPKDKDATGRAVVICPGGGYASLSMEKEGYDWAEFLQNQGITAIVLKYRMPHGKPEVPISDAEQAIKMVRLNATAWKINPNDVGIMGFSAGGHLAATLATTSTGDAKPNFQILFYPVISMMEGYGHAGSLEQFLGRRPNKRAQKQYSANLNVNRITPRAFIALSDDDDVVPPTNGVNYYTELYRNDVSATLHIYPGGGHGWGSKIGFRYHNEIIMELKAWLESF